ncbi:hypothetical protein PG988_007872 [Apiospora saccharicola]
MLRKHLLPEYYPEYKNASGTEAGFMHIMHFVDALRQSVMCNVDLAIIPFQDLAPLNIVGSGMWSGSFTSPRSSATMCVGTSRQCRTGPENMRSATIGTMSTGR